MPSEIAPNKQNLLLWVQALESGEFEQGYGCLRQTDSDAMTYCCLGVATEIASRHGVVVPEVVPEAAWGIEHVCRNMDDDGHVHDLWCLDSGALSPLVSAWLGLGTADPILRIPDDLDVDVSDYDYCASSLNDNEFEPFDEIARRIRIVYDLGERPHGE